MRAAPLYGFRERELEFYEKSKGNLLQNHEGKFVGDYPEEVLERPVWVCVAGCGH